MQKGIITLFVILSMIICLVLPVSAANTTQEQTWTGWLLDYDCVGSNPATHTQSCNLMPSCIASGEGILVYTPGKSNNTYTLDNWLPFDLSSQELAKQLDQILSDPNDSMSYLTKYPDFIPTIKVIGHLVYNITASDDKVPDANGTSIVKGIHIDSISFEYIPGISKYVVTSPENVTLYGQKEDITKPIAKTSLKSGLYNTNKIVKLSINELGTIYYTLNGKTPTNTSTKYTQPINITKTTVLKYLAVDKAGNLSPVYTQTYKIDKIAPTVTKTAPTNNKTKTSRISPITIKFSESIKATNNFNKITVKKLSTGKYVTLTKSIKGNNLSIKTGVRTGNSWYIVTIPKSAIKDTAGNNLQKNYTFKFKTRT